MRGLHEMDEVTWWLQSMEKVAGCMVLLLDHGKEARNGDVECTWVRIVSGHDIGWT